MQKSENGLYIYYVLDGDEWTEYYTFEEQDEVMNENRGFYVSGWFTLLGTDMFESPLPLHIQEIVDGGLL